MASTFEYWKSSKDSQYWFHLKENGNNEIIIASTEGYQTESGCLKGIDSTKTNAPLDSNYKRFEGTDGKHYFSLRAGNYEPVSKSEGYSTASGREKGVENCKREAPYGSVRKLN
jgi:uncharacterized protein